MTTKTPLKIHLDIDLYRWLQKESQLRRCSIGKVVRDMITREINLRQGQGGVQIR